MQQNHMREQVKNKVDAIMNHRFQRRSLGLWLRLPKKSQTH